MEDKFKVIVDGKEYVFHDFDSEVIPTVEKYLKEGKYINRYYNDSEYVCTFELFTYNV